MNTKRASPDWTVCIGLHNFGDAHPAYFNHHAGRWVHLDGRTGTARLSSLQTTGFTVGQLFVQTIMHDSSLVELQIDAFAARYDLRIISPFRSAVVTKPSKAHGILGRRIVSNAIAQSLGWPSMQSSSDERFADLG
jgi:hypothetical protein